MTQPTLYYMANEQDVVTEINRALEVEAEIGLLDNDDMWFIMIEVRYTDNDGNYTGVYAGVLDKAKHADMIDYLKLISE